MCPMWYIYLSPNITSLQPKPDSQARIDIFEKAIHVHFRLYFDKPFVE